MAKINRKYIDKHWLVFLFRGALATIFSCFMLFSGITEIGNIITIVSVFLLFMGIIDTVGALYSSTKKHGWLNAVIDALVDVVAALVLLLFTKDNLIYSLIVVAVYVIISGLIDIFHGFLSTVDPTDRFIRVLTGVAGCIIGAVIINSGDFELTTFIRFFGAYMLLVGASSLIYGVHNRAQSIEDKIARKEARKHAKRKK
jgi:uncharacterized membrane protein HdeD (DUF308 family)